MTECEDDEQVHKKIARWIRAPLLPFCHSKTQQTPPVRGWLGGVFFFLSLTVSYYVTHTATDDDHDDELVGAK